MKKLMIITLILMVFGGISAIKAQDSGYAIGDEAMDFSLPSVEGEEISLSGMEDAKGALVIFSCNTCPYVKAYEDRMIQLHEKYAPKGYPVIAINSNDDQVSPGDSFEEMKKRAKAKNFPFPYVYDESQEVIKAYGGARTPHVFLLNKEDGKYIVKYIGAIDNNYQDASAVTETYVEDAVDAVLDGQPVPVETTKAIGCTIKWSKETE
ncbi:thioredoxin family protein [Echinicola jeungdonensis]|uniref:Thioredoxin family protein n=1 Tax=Echinicola jeungdonensis TaxID=709343 RepID=A0ABV5J757_9BACT|nr:thioredoxin family protein [Echinicola jeungdonensis]MDN3669183.1 thioredoxin family protein [Echinicola jeungdonensis]